VGPGVGMRHLEGPKNPDGLNLGMYIFVHVYFVHMPRCIYMPEGGTGKSLDSLLLFLDIFFLPKETSTRCERNTKNSNPHGLELHRPNYF